MSSVPRPAPARHSAIAAAFPSLSIATGSPSRLRMTSRNGTSTSGMFTEPIAIPARWSIREGSPESDRDHRSRRAAPERRPRARRGAPPRSRAGVGYSRCAAIVPSRPTRPARIFVPPTSTPMIRFQPRAAANVTRRMAVPEEKPYRVYRGGRVKGKVPTPKPERSGPRRPARPARGRHRRWLRWIPVAHRHSSSCSSWSGRSSSYLPVPRTACRRRTSASTGTPAGARRAARATRRTSSCSAPTTRSSPGRESANRSDSITLVRVDTNRHRIAYLSIPRDLVVEIPGHGDSKINAAMQLGGPALAVETVKTLTGLPVNHVVIVDFSQFEKLIDKLGGIDITVAKPIISKFDCPYPTEERCARWDGLALREGDAAHGRAPRADLLARPQEQARPVRHRLLACRAQPAGAERGRGEAHRLRHAGRSCRSSATTCSRRSRPTSATHSFLSLGWSKFRSSGGSTLHCRLGGDGERRRDPLRGGEPERDPRGDRRVGAAAARARTRAPTAPGA